jgi:hypothetical protein
VRNKPKDAEGYYLKAIASNPTHANSLYNYGVLLDSVHKNYDKVQQESPGVGGGGGEERDKAVRESR